MEEEESTDMCQTCLVRGRFLYPLRKLTSALNELGIPIRKDVTTGVCWECKTFIMKIKKFKLQVIKAQDALMEIATHQDFHSLSRLSCYTKYNYDLEIFYTDPLNNLDLENNEVKKEETLSDIENDQLPDNIHNTDKVIFEEDETYIQDATNREGKNTIKRHKTRSCNSKLSEKIHLRKKNFLDSTTIDNEIKLKYTTVVFSEEEMLKNREEKRKQPNFKKIPYKCESCVLGFTRKETYNQHMEKRHNMNIGASICDVCESRFSTSKSLERHRKKHYVVYRCRLCDYETLELWSVVSHCRVKHSRDTDGRIHCPQCSVIVRSPKALSEHVNSQHSLQCTQCGDKFKGKHTLRTHKIRIHGAKRDFTCDLCGKSFKTKSRLEAHIVSHNAALATKLSYCAPCNVQYKNIYVYRNHLKNSANHSERAYECKECKKKFASKVYWRKHWEFYHLHKSQFKCEMCDKLFISDWRLKNHRQTQHGLTRTRNHACNICGKKFFTQSTLRGHQLTHSEERSYMCEDCGDTFKQRPALYTHSRLVHKTSRVTSDRFDQKMTITK